MKNLLLTTVAAIMFATTTHAATPRSNPNVAVPVGLGVLAGVSYAVGTFTGVLPAIAIVTLLAKPTDKLLNGAMGGSTANTISGDAGYAASRGDTGAAFWCGVLDNTIIFRAYDEIELADRTGWEDANHCERRRMEDAGELVKTTINYSAPEWNLARVGERRGIYGR